MADPMSVLAVELAPGHKGGLRLRAPVIVASGAAGSGAELPRTLEPATLGAVVAAGVARRPRAGWRDPEAPRVREAPAGLLYAPAALPRAGIEALAGRWAAAWSGWDVPVIANVRGADPEECAALAGQLDETPGVAAVELDLMAAGAPADDGRASAEERVAAMVARARRATALPLLAKLAPGPRGGPALARAAARAGADAVVLCGVLPALDPLPATGRVDAEEVWLVGPAVLPVTLGILAETARALRAAPLAVPVPLIAAGGIHSAEQALRCLLLGATAVQIGTAALLDPAAPAAMAGGLASLVAARSVRAVGDLVGAELDG